MSPRDPSCAAWYRTRMRSTTLSVSTDAKKNPSGRVRYSIKFNWNSAHGKTLSGACRITPVSRGRVQGLDLEVGFCGFATRAVNWYLIRQMNQPHLPISLYKIYVRQNIRLYGMKRCDLILQWRFYSTLRFKQNLGGY